MKVFITADFSDEGVELLKKAGHSVCLGGWGSTGSIFTEDELIAALGDSEVLIVGYEPVTRKVIDATCLRIICSIRGGPRANIDVDYATEKGIPVTYTRGREAIPVADFTMGQIIALVRHIAKTDRELRRGVFTAPEKQYGSAKDVIWDMSDEGPWQSRKGIELPGKTLGIVGFGTVGQEVARRAKGFGMRVIAFDPYQSEAAFAELGAEKVALDDLVARADIVTIHARGDDSNKGMLGKRQFDLMKRGAYFVNNARAAIVDEAALREALASGKLAGAALDVHHSEPIKDNDPLLKMDNVICTPHIAGAGIEVIYRHSRMIVEHLAALLSARRPDAICNPEVLERVRF